MTNTMRKDSKYYATKNLIGKILIYVLKSYKHNKRALNTQSYFP